MVVGVSASAEQTLPTRKPMTGQRQNRRATLFPKQQAFIAEYLKNGGNAVAAYRIAYGDHHSVQTASRCATRILADDRIRAVLASAHAQATQAMAQVAEQHTISRTRNLEELARIAFADIGDIALAFDGRTPYEAIRSLSKHQRAAIKQFRARPTEHGTEITVWLYDKLGAIKQISEMHGWDQPELDTPEGAIDTERRARIRAEMLQLLADMARPRQQTIEADEQVVRPPPETRR